jgi:hypothetical protein
MESEQWLNIDAEQIIHNGEVQGTRDPTGHMLLLDMHFELPFEDVNVHNDQQQNQMGYGSNFMNQNQYIEGYNDYGENQSFYNCPNQASYGNNYGHTLPASHSSLETSRQNSYEKDERQYYDINNYNGQYQDYSPTYENGTINEGECDDGLYYNSRPFK